MNEAEDTVAEGQPLFSADPRTLTALGERVAVVETKVGSLKEDTGVIRSSMHGINNEMMKFVALEQKCVSALEAIASKMLERDTQMTKIATDVTSLLAARDSAEGAWWATVRISSIVVAAITIIGVAARLLGFIK